MLICLDSSLCSHVQGLSICSTIIIQHSSNSLPPSTQIIEKSANYLRAQINFHQVKFSDSDDLPDCDSLPYYTVLSPVEDKLLNSE